MRLGGKHQESAAGRRPLWALVLGPVAVLFGVATIVSGGTVLFGDTGTRAAAGAVVPFVLWFNFLAGFAYVAAGLGVTFWKPWAPSSRRWSPPRHWSLRHSLPPMSWPAAPTRCGRRWP